MFYGCGFRILRDRKFFLLQVAQRYSLLLLSINRRQGRKNSLTVKSKSPEEEEEKVVKLW